MKKSTGIILLVSFLVIMFVIIVFVASIGFYLLQGTTPTILGGKKLALVRIEGLIYDVEEWVDQLKEYQEDSSIKGIVLRVDSPGGAIGPSQELYQVIQDCKEKYNKVVVASFGSIAASGGYYIVCGADQIVTTPGTLTGSIGVYAKFFEAKGLFDKIGIDYETVKAGEYKDFGSMERGLSEKEREMMQSVIDDSYLQFIEAVMEGRQQQLLKLLTTLNPREQSERYPFTHDVMKVIDSFQQERQRYMESQEIEISSVTEETNVQKFEDFKPGKDTILELTRRLAEGKVYTGRQAKNVGLVDSIGTLDDAITLTAKLCGIRGEPTVVERQIRELTIFDLLSQKVNSLVESKPTSPLQYRFPYQ